MVDYLTSVVTSYSHFLNTIKYLVKVNYKLCRSRGGGGWYLTPIGTGTCRGWTGGGSQARSPAPCALVSSRRGWRGNSGGVNLKRMGKAPRLTRRGGGLCHLTTGDGSHWFRTSEPWPPGFSGGWPWLELSPLYSSRTHRYVSTAPSTFVQGVW